MKRKINRIIYLTINLLNGKVYIGKDKYNNINYLGSGSILKKAIKKYGKENFRKQIICYCNSEDEMNQKEIFWIAYYRKTGFKMYNISTGGDWGDTISNHPNKKEIINNMKKNLKKYYKTHSSPRKEVILSKKIKKKLSISGKLYFKTHNGINKGKTFSKEHRNNISKTRKMKFKNGELIPPMQNKHHTIKSRNSMSKTKKENFKNGKTIPWNKGKTGVQWQKQTA